MADEAIPLRKSIDPMSDGSGGFLPPGLASGMLFQDIGSYGLRQYSGWVREEFLPQLVGRQAATVYREMLDNSSTVGSMMFAITQMMRKIQWRVEAPTDNVAKRGQSVQREVEFADSLRLDMSHTWEDFIAESLSMLGYGFSVHELVYKRRVGKTPTRSDDVANQRHQDTLPGSEYNDGRIGWRRLPIRSQDTILKWFFDQNGQIKGVTQQPWIGTLIDIPVEKLLLFRASSHKNNPEGRSVLRSAYRSWYFTKRLEELESILFERMAGFPVLYVPSSLMDASMGTGPEATKANMALQAYKNIVTNSRINEQMGAVLPSDTYKDAEGKPSNVKMYEFQLLTPQHGRGQINVDTVITRHKVDILMTTLCDFIQMGHEVRGTNNLGTLKVDMFYNAVEGWMDAISGVMNRYALPRMWKLNGLDLDTMPQYRPDMPQRLDLDGLGTYIGNLATAGMPLFPDDELQAYLRDAAGLPEVGEDAEPVSQQQAELDATADLNNQNLKATSQEATRQRAHDRKINDQKMSADAKRDRARMSAAAAKDKNTLKKILQREMAREILKRRGAA